MNKFVAEAQQAAVILDGSRETELESGTLFS